MTNKITISENAEGYADKYRCTIALQLLLILSHTYSIVIDFGVGTPGHGKDVVHGCNVTNKKFL